MTMRLEITPEERDELLSLVDNYFKETRVEVRHTQNREFREGLHREEEILRGLRDKLAKAAETVIPTPPSMV